MTDVKTPSKLEKILAQGHLAVTSECGPPRGSDAEEIKKKAELIRNHVDAINITDNQTSVTRLCSLAACIHLKGIGVEPVLQMVVRDRNRIAIQSDILGAASFDINNMLWITGKHHLQLFCNYCFYLHRVIHCFITYTKDYIPCAGGCFGVCGPLKTVKSINAVFEHSGVNHFIAWIPQGKIHRMVGWKRVILITKQHGHMQGITGTIHPA